MLPSDVILTVNLIPYLCFLCGIYSAYTRECAADPVIGFDNVLCNSMRRAICVRVLAHCPVVHYWTIFWSEAQRTKLLDCT